jgi:hypothetical protein
VVTILKVGDRVRYVPGADRSEMLRAWRGCTGTVLDLILHVQPPWARVRLDERPPQWPYKDDLIFAPDLSNLEPAGQKGATKNV